MKRVACAVLGLTLWLSGTVNPVTPTPAARAMDWRQGAYDDTRWPSGYAPLGFDDPSVETDITAGRPTYYFRKLFMLPSTYEPAMTALRLTVHTGDGVIVSFHGTEAGRSAWLPPGDLPYDCTGSFTDPSGEQVFDLTDILFQCENSIGNNWRTVTVETHRHSPDASFRFDAVMEARFNGVWQEVIAPGSRWAYCPDPSTPDRTTEPVLNALRYPLCGLPEVTTPGGRIHMIIDIDSDMNPFIANPPVAILSSSRNTILLPPPALGSADEQGRVYYWDIPEDAMPGTYDIYLFSEMFPAVQTARRSLVILNRPEESLSMVHISDSHVPFRGQYSRDNTAALQRVLDGFPELQPDLVIHTGDGYDEGNGRDQAELFRTMMDACESPVVYVGGNHELGEWCGDGNSRENYWDFLGWPRLDPRRSDHLTARTRDYVIDIGHVSLVCVETWESYSSFWTEWYPYDSISTDQAQWMMQVASERPDQTLVACYHHDFNGGLEQEVLPWAGYAMGLSGHTHSHDEYQVGPVHLYKVGSTYQASRPQRWFHFHDGIPEGGDLLMADPVDIQIDPPQDTMATTRTVSIQNHEFNPIPGHRVWIPMISGIEYTVVTSDPYSNGTSPELTGQWDGPFNRWVCIAHHLAARAQVIYSVVPAEASSPEVLLAFHAGTNLFLAGERSMITLSMENTGDPNMVQLFIALEAAGQFFFWPEWETEPSMQRIFMNSGQLTEVTVLDITWPDSLPVFGETVTFWSAALDEGSGTMVSPVAQTRCIY